MVTGDEFDTEALRPVQDLFVGSGTEGVASSEQRPPILLFELPGKLCARGGLARTVDAEQANNLRRFSQIPKPSYDSIQNPAKNSRSDLGNILLAECLIRTVDYLDLVQYLLGGLDTEVRSKQDLLQLLDGLLIQLFVEQSTNSLSKARCQRLLQLGKKSFHWTVSGQSFAGRSVALLHHAVKNAVDEGVGLVGGKLATEFYRLIDDDHWGNVLAVEHFIDAET